MYLEWNKYRFEKKPFSGHEKTNQNGNNMGKSEVIAKRLSWVEIKSNDSIRNE